MRIGSNAATAARPGQAGVSIAIMVLVLVGPWGWLDRRLDSAATAQETLETLYQALESGDAIGPLDFFTRTFYFDDAVNIDVEPVGQGPVSSGAYSFWEGRYRYGPRFRSFVNGTPPAHNHADSRFDDNAGINEAPATVQIWFPDANSLYPMSFQLDPGNGFTPLIVVSQSPGGFRIPGGTSPSGGPTDAEAVNLGRYLASRGVVFVRFIQGDYYGSTIAPEGADPGSLLNPLWHQFGFNGESGFSTITRDWCRSFGDGSHSPGGTADKTLSRSDLRLDYRWALGQGFFVTGTFVRRLVERYWEELGGTDEGDGIAWSNAAKIMYSGGSKDGAGAQAAAGAEDPESATRRCVAMRVGGVQAWDLGVEDSGGAITRLGTTHRFETDWLEGTASVFGRLEHKNTTFFRWAYDAIFDDSLGLQAPYHATVYTPSRDETRYEDLLIVDDVGTHDNLWPLDPSESWWREHDGLAESGASWTISGTEVKWNVRRSRGINKDHGRESNLDPVAINALASLGGDLYAGGLFALRGGVAEHHVAKWNGTVWSLVGGTFNGDIHALAVANGVLYAGGAFTTVRTSGGATTVDRLAKFDGSAWAAHGGGSLDGPVRALAGDSTYLYAGGDFLHQGSNNLTRIGRFTLGSSTWSQLNAGLDDSVHALFLSGSTLYAGGAFVQEAGSPSTTLNGVGKWSGTAWLNLRYGIQYGGVQSGAVLALASDGTSVFVGGDFAGALYAANTKSIAKWSGSAWSALGNGINGPVRAILYHSGTSSLFAGGAFNQIVQPGSTLAPMAKTCRIVRWTPSTSSWSPLDEGLNNDVLALAVDPDDADNVTAGGRFTEAGHYSGSSIANVSTILVAQWDISASAWSALGSTLSPPAPALNPPVRANDHLTRRAAESQLLSLNDVTPRHLPRVDRAAFNPSTTSDEDWTMQVRVEDLPSSPVLSWKVHTAFSDDRDFRRYDGPGAIGTAVCRGPKSIAHCYPAEASETRYFDTNEATANLGENVLDNADLDAERASPYFGTASWEDFFYTVTPSVSEPDSNGFYTLTFDPPVQEGYPWGVTSPKPMVACIVELRVGANDDGLEDDICFTETAFGNDSDSQYDLYSLDSLPNVDNTDAPIQQVWPAKAKPGDFVYIVGDRFYLRNDGGSSYSADEIDFVRFTYSDSGSDDVKNTSAGDQTPILLVGGRVIRCQLPFDAKAGSTSVRIHFTSLATSELGSGMLTILDE